MSEETQKSEATAADFVIAKVNERYVRFASVADVPEGSAVVDPQGLNAMTNEAIGELYGVLATVGNKKFKTKKIAIESVIYQINKMPVFDPNAVKVAPVATKSDAREPKVAKVAKSPDTFELLQPPEVEKVLRALAPQARELVLIMTDLAKERSAVSFSGADLDTYLKVPETAARLHTKQDPLRILQYYKGKLISVGLIRVS